MFIWIIYVVLVSALVGAAAFAAEQRAYLRRQSSRWIWMLAIVASLLIPTIIASVSIQLPDVFSPGLSQKIITLKEVTSVHLSPTVWIAGTSERASDYKNLDSSLKQLWIVLSAIMLCGLIASAIHLFWQKRRWVKGTISQTSVLISDDVGPAVVGLISPHIVIPRWLLQSPDRQQQAVIAHEQSHLDAGDPQLLSVALCLLVFMPWNLPLWWQLRRLRCAIEVDCDARVLKSGQDLANYGETLIAVGERQSGYIGSVAGMSESKSFLEKRIKLMLTKPKRWWRISATILGLFSIGLFAVAAQVSPPNANNSANNSAAGKSGEITLPTSALDNHTGIYKFGDTAVMTVTRDGAHIYAQLTGQPAAEIFPETKTKFFYKIVNAQLTFVVDTQGKATSLVLHQNGNNITAPRIDAAEAEQIRAATESKIQNQSATPGSEAALRGLIAGIASGNPDYSTMGPELAQVTRAQLSHLRAGTVQLGAVKTVEFRGVGSQGWDIYNVKHEHGTAQWRIQLSSAGIITGALLSPAP